MQVLPLRDRVLIRRSVAEKVTPGGLVIPGNAQEKPAEGEILAIGPGGILMDGTICPLAVEVGQRVLFAKTAGVEVRSGDEDLLLVREADILCVMRP